MAVVGPMQLKLLYFVPWASSEYCHPVRMSLIPADSAPQTVSCMPASTWTSWEPTPPCSARWGARRPCGQTSTTPDGWTVTVPKSPLWIMLRARCFNVKPINLSSSSLLPSLTPQTPLSSTCTSSPTAQSGTTTSCISFSGRSRLRWARAPSPRAVSDASAWCVHTAGTCLPLCRKHSGKKAGKKKRERRKRRKKHPWGGSPTESETVFG